MALAPRTEADELHALAWQATGEIARLAALNWVLVAEVMPPGRHRAAIAEITTKLEYLLKMQDEIMATLTPGRPE